jgi:hypothetical protein
VDSNNRSEVLQTSPFASWVPRRVTEHSRLLKKADRLRCRVPAALRRTHPSEWVPEYASRLGSRGALHLGLFEQPGQNEFFSNLIGNSPATVLRKEHGLCPTGETGCPFSISSEWWSTVTTRHGGCGVRMKDSGFGENWKHSRRLDHWEPRATLRVARRFLRHNGGRDEPTGPSQLERQVVHRPPCVFAGRTCDGSGYPSDGSSTQSWDGDVSGVRSSSGCYRINAAVWLAAASSTRMRCVGNRSPGRRAGSKNFSSRLSSHVHDRGRWCGNNLTRIPGHGSISSCRGTHAWMRPTPFTT